MLRTIFRVAIERWPDTPVSATNLLELAVEKDYYKSKEKPNLMALGLIFTRQFPASGVHKFAGEFEVTRRDVNDASTNFKPIKYYTIRRLTGAAHS